MNFRILIWLFFCFLINICSACQCVNPPFYFTQNLQYDYICHVKIIKHYPVINSPTGDFLGLTKVVVLNGRNANQILDTLLFINTCPSLICGLRLDHFPVGKELVIKAFNQAMNYNSEFLCNQEIVTDDTYTEFCLNKKISFDYKYQYNFIASHSCDNVILEVENEDVKGIIASKYHSAKLKFYKFIMLFSKTWANSFLEKTKTNKFEKQVVNKQIIFRKLKFISV